MQRLSLSCLAVLAALAVAACGGTTATNAPAVSAAGSAAASASPVAICGTAPVPADADVTVDIKDFTFTPDPITAKVGDVIAWTNSDTLPHTASLADGSCSTDQLATGITGALVFNVPGTYNYQCNIHPGRMKGAITITG